MALRSDGMAGNSVVFYDLDGKELGAIEPYLNVAYDSSRDIKELSEVLKKKLRKAYPKESYGVISENTDHWWDIAVKETGAIEIPKTDLDFFTILKQTKGSAKLYAQEKNTGVQVLLKDFAPGVKYCDEKQQEEVSEAEIKADKGCGEINNSCPYRRVEWKNGSSFVIKKKYIQVIRLELENRCFSGSYSDSFFITDLNKVSSRIQNGVGFKFYKEDNLDKAQAYFEKSINEDPTFSLANFNLACVLALRGKSFIAGKGYLDQALKNESDKKSFETLKIKISKDRDLETWRKDPAFAGWYSQIK